MLKRSVAAVLAAALILLSPGTGAYSALAAVHVQTRVPVASVPSVSKAGLVPHGAVLQNISFSNLSLGVMGALPGVISLTPHAQIPSAPSAAPSSAHTAAVRPAAARTPSGGIGPEHKDKPSLLNRFLEQKKNITAAVSDVKKMPAQNSRAAGAAMMDKLLGIRAHSGGLDESPVGADIDFERKNPLHKPATDESGKGDREKKPPPPPTSEAGAPISPATARGQLGAALITGALASAGIIGSPYLALLTLPGALAYAPLAAKILGWALLKPAAGFLLLGTRIVLNRSGHVEAGDLAPMPRPYEFFQKGAIRGILNTPVTEDRDVYIPSYAKWTLQVHAKVRAKAGVLAAYVVQAFANTRLIVGELAGFVKSLTRLIPVVHMMYQGDDEVRPFVKAHKKSIYALQGINIVQAVMGVAGSYIVGALVDSAIAGSGGIFALMMAGLVAIAVVNFVLNGMYEWKKSKVSTLVLTDFRVKLFGHILTLPFSFFNRDKPSEVAARLAVDVAQLSTKNISIPVVLPYYGAMAFFAGIMMAITSIQSSLLIMAIVPILTLISVIYGNKAEKLNEAQFNRRAQMISAAEETLTTVRDIRAFSTEEKEGARFLEKTDTFLGTIMRKVRISAGYNASISQLYQFSFHILVLATGLIAFMATGSPTVGQTTAMVGYAAFMRQALSGSLDLYTQFRESSGAARRVLEYLKEQPAVEDKEGAVDPGTLKGAVRLSGVTYSQDGYPILRDLSFEIKPGQRAAVVGGPSTTKSALIDLIGHLDNPDSGSIQFDGKETETLQLAPLRRQVSLLHDKGIWINGATLRDNITYGLKRHVKDQEILDALKTAGETFLGNKSRFPDGLDTVLNSDDWRMSDMRKKLLEIARAYLADPRILLLDRPTGSLNETEAAFIDARLAELRRGRTSVTVDQRMDQAQFADIILVLDRGRIAEKGTHAELMALKGVYYKLWRAEKAEDLADRAR